MLSLSGKVARSADRGHVREFYTISVYIKISLFDLFRQLRVTLVATFPDREGKVQLGIDSKTFNNKKPRGGRETSRLPRGFSI